MLSHIMILSADSLCVWCRYGANSQALWVGSCQVMEVSLAQTRRACVPHAKRPIPLSRRQAEWCSEPVVGRCSRTGRKNQDGAADVPQTSGSVAFRFGWLQSHSASGVNSWSHKNIDEDPQTTPLSEGCGCLSWTKKVLTEINFSLKPHLESCIMKRNVFPKLVPH